METVILARHGESEYSVRGLVNGDPSVRVPLTAQGRDEARLLGERLRGRELDLCVTSDFERAEETASVALAGRDVRRLVVPELGDIHMGSFEGKTLEEYRAWSHGAPPTEQLPMVLLVHGGPWSRDLWGLSANHQWLANRGYAVLSVNYRGSTGFGKAFVNAANLEWAGKMHNDLIEAVNWAIAHNIADPARVAIMGTSYGG